MAHRPPVLTWKQCTGWLRGLCVAAVLTLCAAALPPSAVGRVGKPLTITQTPEGVRLVWADAAGAADWPLVTLDGVRVPAQLVAVQVAGAAPSPQVTHLKSHPWNDAIQPAPAIIPQTAAGELRPALARPQTAHLPPAAVSLLRTGRLRGTLIAVYAVSPLFTHAGQAQMATELQAIIPGAVLADPTALVAAAASGPFLADAPGPSNPAALKPAVKLRVTQAGIQEVSGAELLTAGARPPFPSASLQVWHAGRPVAAELRDGGDGSFDPTDTLRFYAGPPGDRWNAADTYWLTLEAQPGVRMSRRPALVHAAATRILTATQTVVWRDNRVYDSALPGVDGDHWFAADLRSGPELGPATFSVPLTVSLPLASGPVTVTLTGSAYTAGTHVLTLVSGTYSTTHTWSGPDNWRHTAVLPAAPDILQITLAAGLLPDGILLDDVMWQVPVALTTAGAGATFELPQGIWQAALAGVGPDQSLYDISTPTAPVALDLDTATPGIFDSGPAPARYVLAGPGTLHTPTLSLYTPAKLTAPLDADVVYLAPAAFLNELAPLAARRRAQGYQVALVDVQALYDLWSGGQTAPEALRDFLRYAAATWARPPRAALLIGDGTSDPLNFTGRNNTNFLPPYLAMVDPWLGETACDTCFGQLDGASPLDDELPDVWIGRLPVKSTAELAALVEKLVGYESAPPDAGPAWRTRNIYIADNYRHADGSTDPAGDFAAFADLSVALQPPWIQVERMYFDPGPGPRTDPWRVADPAEAHARTLALLSAGAGLANYVGHSHHWQWAVTDLTATPPYLLGMYEVDTLGNAGRLPILLEMTCLTSAFQQPAFSGTTIDERFILQRNGGAIAVWGPTGLGLMHGHDALQRGFYTALWAALPGTAPLGALTTAGYLELFSHGSDLDALRTFLLLGDPLTPARIFATLHFYLPLTLK